MKLRFACEIRSLSKRRYRHKVLRSDAESDEVIWMLNMIAMPSHTADNTFVGHCTLNSFIHEAFLPATSSYAPLESYLIELFSVSISVSI